MDWKNIVNAVAPVLGTALGGPLGGIAVKAISGALGITEQTEEAIGIALSGAKPDDLLKLKQADQQFAKDMRALDVDLDRLAVSNTKDARQLQIATRSYVPAILAVLVLISWISVEAFLLSHVIDQSMRELIARMLGTLDAALTLVLSFYFGSSMSSAHKDSLIASQNIINH